MFLRPSLSVWLSVCWLVGLFFVSLLFCPFVCLFVCLFLVGFMFASPSACLLVGFSVCQYLYPSVCLSVCLFVRLSTTVCLSDFLCLSVSWFSMCHCLSVMLSSALYLSVCVSFFPSFILNLGLPASLSVSLSVSVDTVCLFVCLSRFLPVRRLRSFSCFAVRSSSAHEGKITILERFRCSLTKIIQLNWELVKLIGKIEICSI